MTLFLFIKNILLNKTKMKDILDDLSVTDSERDMRVYSSLPNYHGSEHKLFMAIPPFTSDIALMEMEISQYYLGSTCCKSKLYLI